MNKKMLLNFCGGDNDCFALLACNLHVLMNLSISLYNDRHIVSNFVAIHHRSIFQ